MEEIVKLVYNYGTGIVVVGLFLWDWINNKNKNTRVLDELSKSNNNIASVLMILKDQFAKHEDRTDTILENVKEIKMKVRWFYMLDKISKLIDLKSIITLLFTFTFIFITIKGTINAEQFLMSFTTILIFYFTKKEKNDWKLVKNML